MTLQNLGKLLDFYDEKLGSTKNAEKFELLKELPFYCQWPNHYQSTAIRKLSSFFCCFNHAVGLPNKDGNSYPLFDYEILLFNALFRHYI